MGERNRELAPGSSEPWEPVGNGVVWLSRARAVMGACSSSTDHEEPCKLSHFERLGVIGQGSFGLVIAARDKRCCRERKRCQAFRCLGSVALKLQCLKALLRNKEHAREAIKERDLLVRLRSSPSPFIVKIRAAFVTRNDICLVLPLVLGGDLRHHLRQYGKFEVSRVRFYAAELSGGLEAIHDAGVIYRDLKPDNIMLTERGHVIITDFDRSRDTRCTGVEAVCMEFSGTPGYMAPELINCSDGYGQEIDVWALGIVIYELLTATLPFDPSMALETSVSESKHFLSPPELPSKIPTEVQQFVQSTLKFLPAQRIGCSSVKQEAKSTTKPASGRVNWAVIRQHPFWKGIDWKPLLRGEVEPPPLLTIAEHVEEVQVLYKSRKHMRKEANLKFTKREEEEIREYFGRFQFDAHGLFAAVEPEELADSSRAQGLCELRPTRKLKDVPESKRPGTRDQGLEPASETAKLSSEDDDNTPAVAVAGRPPDSRA